MITIMTMTTMIKMLFCLFPFLLFSLGCLDVVVFRDIINLANCDGATEGRTDTTSYRDDEAHLKRREVK